MFIDNKTYKIILENTLVETVDIILINKNKQVLLGLRNNQPLQNTYYIPGGRRIKNELLLDAVKRKVQEELGVIIDETKLEFLGIYDDIFDNSMFQNTSSHYSAVTYVYHISDVEQQHITINEQHSDLKFFDVDDESLHYMVKRRISDMKKMGII